MRKDIFYEDKKNIPIKNIFYMKKKIFMMKKKFFYDKKKMFSMREKKNKRMYRLISLR